ncbi:MAG: glycosyltransferase family 2 protein [bacterium]
MSLSERSINRITTLILTYNRRDELKVCLDSVERQDFPAVQIIVVDNNSTDGTSTMIREEYDDIDYIGLEENQGIAARNLGADRAEGDLIVSLDDDSELPSPTTLTRIAEKFENNNNLGAAGFRLIDGEGREDPWFKWDREGTLKEGYKCPTFIGCGAAIRPEMFERVGGFWEPYFMHLEERDFALRILQSGSEVRYFPSVSIIHHHRSARREDARFIYYVTRNTFWYIWRNFPLLLAFFKTFVELFKLGAMAVRKGGFGVYLRGLWDVRLQFGEVWRTRDPADPSYLGWISGRFEEDIRER